MAPAFELPLRLRMAYHPLLEEVFDMRSRSACVTLFLLGFTALAFPQTTPPRGQARDRQGGGGAASPAFDTPRPIELRESVWLEELTWMEARDLLKAGTKTIIIPTGGVEQNGPYLAAGKHNYVLQATCPAIARKLGKTLCAPIVPFVPEGDIDPPTGMMRYPSTISVSKGTYEALLTDIASSLKQHGFEHIILIGDSGGNQEGMKTVAAELSAKWTGGKTTIHFIPEYYDYPGAYKWADQNFGWQEKVEGIHDDPTISSIMMTVDPNLVRIREREAKGLASINGISLLPVEKAVEAGRKIVEYRADLTAAAIRKALGAS
jgi:creatinine amidohydrolase/Fe(II)-dependent formamide hydrolase-like protein